MRIYVGNLPFSTTEDSLRATFEAHGQVESASIVIDRETGRSRGFGFVEMRNDSEAQAAITASTASPWMAARSSSTRPSPVRPAAVAAAVSGAAAVVAAAAVSGVGAAAAVVAAAAGKPFRS